MESCTVNIPMEYVSPHQLYCTLFMSLPPHTPHTHAGPGSIYGHTEHAYNSQETEATLITRPWGVSSTLAACH